MRLDRSLGAAHITVRAPADAQPTTPAELVAAGADAWLVAAARELDDAMLDLRFNEPEIGTWVLRAEGDASAVLAAEALLGEHPDHWLAREVRLLWGRTLKRLDLSARTLVALVEPGSCFAGTLAELLLGRRPIVHARRHRARRRGRARRRCSSPTANDGWYPDGERPLPPRHPLLGPRRPRCVAARALFGKELLAAEAADAGLVTFTPDDIDWDDEVRLALEERRSFSPDALTGMEANLRFPGPETMETKIFARLSAWQNWIFQRPNAVGPAGALRSFGTGNRPDSTERGSDHDRRRHRRHHPEQRRPGERSAPPASPRIVATEVHRVVEGPRPRRLPGQRRVPAHRGRGRAGGLGQLRPRQDARLPLGHLPRRSATGPPHRLRRPPRRARLAGGARASTGPTFAASSSCRATPNRRRSSSNATSASPRRASTTSATCSR